MLSTISLVVLAAALGQATDVSVDDGDRDDRVRTRFIFDTDAHLQQHRELDGFLIERMDDILDDLDVDPGHPRIKDQVMIIYDSRRPGRYTLEQVQQHYRDFVDRCDIIIDIAIELKGASITSRDIAKAKADLKAIRAHMDKVLYTMKHHAQIAYFYASDDSESESDQIIGRYNDFKAAFVTALGEILKSLNNGQIDAHANELYAQFKSKFDAAKSFPEAKLAFDYFLQSVKEVVDNSAKLEPFSEAVVKAWRTLEEQSQNCNEIFATLAQAESGFQSKRAGGCNATASAASPEFLAQQPTTSSAILDVIAASAISTTGDPYDDSPPRSP